MVAETLWLKFCTFFIRIKKGKEHDLVVQEKRDFGVEMVAHYVYR